MYIPAHVDETRPQLKSSMTRPFGPSRMLKARVKLPKNRPGHWWAMTVS